MGIPSKLFANTTQDEKLAFFLKVQELLVANHPNSEFIMRENNVADRLKFAKDIVHRYKGMVYVDDTIAVLFNHVKVADPNQPDVVATLRDYMFKEAAEDYNCISIDFAAFRHLKDCLPWVQSQYDPRILYVMYIKNGKPQVFKTEELISKVFSIPKAV